MSKRWQPGGRLRWRCARGHIWYAQWLRIRAGRWCRRCKRADRMKSCRALARRRGGRCLSRKYSKTLTWRCASGHEWRARVYDVVARKTWCARCAHLKRPFGRARKARLRSRVQKAAAAQGGLCVSRAIHDTMQRVSWRCAKGHAWQTTVNSIVNQGTWCPQCARRRVPSLEEVRAFATARGAVCLSRRVDDPTQALTWRCKNGHVWHARWTRVRRRYEWCPRCKRKRLTLEEMEAVARARGGTCLSRRYSPAPAKLKWRCARGHVWTATGTQVRRGTWCPTCANHRRRAALKAA